MDVTGRDGDITSRLSGEGYRLTPQRLMILSAIEETNHHISAEEIHAQISARYPHVNISTVYRTLELLNKLGLVTQTDFGGGSVRYHAADKGHHHHLVCQSCGKITDLDEGVFEPLRETLIGQYHFVPELRHLAIMGRCADCQPGLNHPLKP